MLNVWFGSMVALCLFFTDGKAQDSLAVFNGVITDTLTEETLSYVQILIRDGRDTIAITETNEEGRYEFAKIPPGVYKVEYKLYTYYGVIMPQVDFKKGETTTQDLKMKEDRLFEGLHMAKPKPEGIRDFIIIIPTLTLFVLAAIFLT